ncbi:hypothetical protein JXQ70_13300 [bacterium]|nr:hypothetical protein [bacterium]
MLRRFTLSLACLISLLLINRAFAGENLQLSRQYWSVKHSDGQGLVLHCHFPDLEMKREKIGSVSYVRISLPGLRDRIEPGQPQLPALTIPFYAPPDCDISLSWSGAVETFPLAVKPVPKPMLQARRDPTTDQVFTEQIHMIGPQYDSAYLSCFPENPVRIIHDGYFRQYRLVTLAIEPVRAGPAMKQAYFHRDLEISVSFRPAKGCRQESNSYPVYKAKDEQASLRPFLKTLAINYQAMEKGEIPLMPRQPDMKAVTEQYRDLSGLQTQSAYRITLEQAGMYRISYAELDAAGFPLASTDPRYLCLYFMDHEVAILIPGEDDGVFDPDDTLLFYGTHPATTYSDESAYWLIVSDNMGDRMVSQDGTPNEETPLITQFTNTVRIESDLVYWSNIPNGTGLDHWFWHKVLAPASNDYIVDLPFPVSGQDATIRSWFHGNNYNDSVDPDHHVLLALNTNSVDDIYWDGQLAWQSEAVFSTDILANGQNTIQCELPGDTGSSYESIYTNRFEIEYPCLFETETNRLRFQLEEIGPQRVAVDGFTNDELFLFDITDQEHVLKIINPTIEDMGSTYKLTFEQDLTESHRYEMLTQDQFLTVSDIQIDAGSSLHDTSNQADLIIIAPGPFLTVLEPLIQHRMKQGYSVFFADIQNVYDEFSAGHFNPEALTLFLKYAYDYWDSPAPLAALLVGEANFDYHDHYGTGLKNGVPTFLLESSVPLFGETVSDHPASQLRGEDDIPDIFIGRVTVLKASELRDYIMKLIAYETRFFASNWNNNVLLVADDDIVFENSLNTLQTNYLDPSGLVTNKVYLGSYGGNVDQASQDIITQVTSGQLLTLYMGHGSIVNWGVNLLDLEDISSLSNGYKQTLVASTSCLNGYFAHNINIKSISEEWQRYRQKGSMVVTSSTSLSSAENGLLFNSRLLEQFLINDEHRTGCAVFAAEILACLYDGLDIEHMIMQSHLGDPLTMLRRYGSAPASIFGFDRSLYFSEDDEAVLVLWDAEANQSNLIQETVVLAVSSPSDPTGFSLTLMETSTDSGVFRTDVGSALNLKFSTTISNPLEGILKVSHGEQIQAVYHKSLPLQIYTETALWYQYTLPAISWCGLGLLLLGLSLVIFHSGRKHLARVGN